MIIGIGVDTINISRVKSVIERKGEDEFLKRNYTDTESKIAKNIANDKKRVAHLAKRFAAKEAFAKALGTGIGKIRFTDIGIANDSLGKPFFILEENAQKLLKEITPKGHITSCNLSLCDTDDLAQAFVIISSEVKT